VGVIASSHPAFVDFLIGLILEHFSPYKDKQVFQSHFDPHCGSAQSLLCNRYRIIFKSPFRVQGIIFEGDLQFSKLFKKQFVKV